MPALIPNRHFVKLSVVVVESFDERVSPFRVEMLVEYVLEEFIRAGSVSIGYLLQGLDLLVLGVNLEGL